MVLRPRCDRNWAGQISSKRRTVVERPYHIVHMKGAMNSARYVAKTVKVLMPTVESPGFWDSCRRCGFRSTLLRSRCHAWGTAPGRAGRRLQESATVQASALATVNRPAYAGLTVGFSHGQGPAWGVGGCATNHHSPA